MTQQTILLTGASGFVGTHVLKAFLESGYNVKATVRSDEKAKNVAAIFPEHKEQLSFAIVEDIVADNAFDEAVKDVSGVVHTASPFHTQPKDNKKDLLDPAMKGTENIVSAIKKNAPQVKRLVVTSSFAAMIDIPKGNREGYTYTESDWNPVTYKEATESETGSVVYCASKTFAEKVAYDFVKNEKPNFTVATICPPMIYGPAVQHIESLEHLNTSSADIYRFMNGSTKTPPANSFWAWVDVRDVATAHVRAYEHAAGGRFFVTGGAYSYSEVVDILHKVPEVNKEKLTAQDKDFKEPSHYSVDNSKAKNELGINFITLEKSITDAAKELVKIEKRLEKKN